jgi:hypothetical protein
MKALKTENNILVGIPKTFMRPDAIDGAETDGYDTAYDYHDIDGWGLILPKEPIDEMTQRYGAIDWIEADNTFFYPIVELTEEEMEVKVQEQKYAIIANAQSEQQKLINQFQQKQVLEVVQALPDNEALDNQAIYPMWSDFEDEHRFNPPIKVQDFEGTELKLFKAIQPNDKRENTRPIDFPAGWSKIEFSGGIEVWAQPIGGDGKYPYLDPNTGNPYLVTHNDKTWKNNVQDQLNVWEPSVYGWNEVT